MAMKKAGIEANRAQYHALMAKAHTAEQEGLYREVVVASLSACDHIDGMMQYERRYEDKAFDSIESIDMVLRYAPLLLDFHVLDRLDSLLKAQRRIDKNTSASLIDKLANAREFMWDVHRLWEHLEQYPNTRQDESARILGGDQDQWQLVVEAWEKMQLLHRTPEGGSYRLTLSTRMGAVVPGKCPSCGVVTEAPKAMLLEQSTCPACGKSVMFVIRPTRVRNETKE